MTLFSKSDSFARGGQSVFFSARLSWHGFRRGFDVKCPSQAHALKYLVLSFWEVLETWGHVWL